MITHRPRRNRKNEAMRKLVRENIVTAADLIAPLFIREGKGEKTAIAAMPGQYRLSADLILKEVAHLKSLGVGCVSLFPALPDDIKDPRATESANPKGLLPRTINMIKEAHPDMLVMSDVAMDPYSSDGHDGLVDPATGEILNDESLEVLGEMALTQARAGSDIIGPSDMMDGRVGYLRQILDDQDFAHVSIMSYTAKYASAFYGPFREALESAPKHGDKKTYQMDPANAREALREMFLDEQEGADILMVKPGLAYLDILCRMRENTTLPLAVYNVSGEYAMIKAASERGWINHDQAMVEMLTAFKRAGSDMILTYFAREMAELLDR